MLDAIEMSAAGSVELKSHLGEDGRGADTLMWVQEQIFGHRYVEE